MDDLLVGFGKLLGTLQMGSIAEWVTGLLTFAAVMVAVSTFRHERDLVARGQVRNVRMDLELKVVDDVLKNVVRIRNLSDAPIFEVSFYFAPEKEELHNSLETWDGVEAKFKELTVPRKRDHVLHWRRARLLRLYRRTRPDLAYRFVGEIAPGKSRIYRTPVIRTDRRHYFGFSDTSGKRWMIGPSRSKFLSEGEAESIRRSSFLSSRALT